MSGSGDVGQTVEFLCITPLQSCRPIDRNKFNTFEKRKSEGSRKTFMIFDLEENVVINPRVWVDAQCDIQVDGALCGSHLCFEYPYPSRNGIGLELLGL